MSMTAMRKTVKAAVATTLLVAGLVAAAAGVAHAAADCDLAGIGREGTAPHGTQVSIGGKVFICNDGEWTML